MRIENKMITFITEWAGKDNLPSRVKQFFLKIKWINTLKETPDTHKDLFTFHIDGNKVYIYIDDKQPNSESSNLEWAEELLEAFEKEKDIESVYIIKNEITESIIANRTIDGSNIIKEYGNKYYLVHCKS